MLSLSAESFARSLSATQPAGEIVPPHPHLLLVGNATPVLVLEPQPFQPYAPPREREKNMQVSV